MSSMPETPFWTDEDLGVIGDDVAASRAGRMQQTASRAGSRRISPGCA